MIYCNLKNLLVAEHFALILQYICEVNDQSDYGVPDTRDLILSSYMSCYSVCVLMLDMRHDSNSPS